jgi:hypothetical protein
VLKNVFRQVDDLIYRLFSITLSEIPGLSTTILGTTALSPSFLTHPSISTVMSDFLKKFKSVFIVEDPTGGNSETTAKTSQQQTTIPATAPVKVQAPAASATGSVSNKFVEILSAALEKNNPEGFDYFEFRQSLINLAKMPMDETTRFQSAYAMAQTMGVTAAKLTESAQYYLNVLIAEQSKFGEAHAQQRTKLIGSREEDIKNLDQTILQKAEQIKKLTEEIEAHRKLAEQIKSEVSESTIKIENTKADFEATFSSVYQQIDTDLKKMQEYLK